jgi:DNA helicase-2/ATP-dependent DNA helicase PcrA
MAAVLDEKILPARAHAGLSSFKEIIDSLSTRMSKLNPAEVVDATISQSELSRSFEKESPIQKQTRLENLSQLVSAAVEYQSQQTEPSVAGFLDNVSLLTDLDAVKTDAPCLLMTLHGAKGLEFDAVFLTGMEEGLFPHTLSLGNRRSVEEERRLCYVGMTRAKTRLTLTFALSRKSALQSQDRAPSRFLGEIPPALLERDPSGSTPVSNPSCGTPGGLRPGTTVRHSLFGEGTVVEVDSLGRDQKVTVIFRSAGKKKLMTRHANLEVLNSKPRRRRW